MSDRPSPSTEPAATTRRTILRAAGLVALSGGGAGVLGACTADAEVGTPASSAPATSASSAPASSSAPAESPSPSESGSPSTEASPSESVPSGPGAATSEVPVGGGVILEDADYVITQPSRGEFKAFSKICTHQNCPVTEIANGTINCNCHGSRFSIEDGGVANGPATRPLPAAEVTVAGGQVVVTA